MHEILQRKSISTDLVLNLASHFQLFWKVMSCFYWLIDFRRQGQLLLWIQLKSPLRPKCPLLQWFRGRFLWLCLNLMLCLNPTLCPSLTLHPKLLQLLRSRMVSPSQVWPDLKHSLRLQWHRNISNPCHVTVTITVSLGAKSFLIGQQVIFTDFLFRLKN